MRFTTVLYYFQLSAFLLSFLISLRLIRNRHVPLYMRQFYLYSLVAVSGLYSVNLIRYYHPADRTLILVITLLALCFHYVFLSRFFYLVFRNTRQKRSFLILALVSVPLVLYGIYLNSLDPVGLQSFSIVNFFLFSYCIIYFYHLLTGSPKEALLKEPAFWIVSGIFFSLGMTIPLHSIFHYIETNLGNEMLEGLKAIGYFAFGTMHLFFTKAYVCSLKPRKILWS